jgi:hypothetical protein
MVVLAGEAKPQYSAIVLGATERRRTHRAASNQERAVQETGGGDAPQDGRLRRPKVSEVVVVNMDRLEEEVAPHAHVSKRRRDRARQPEDPVDEWLHAEDITRRIALTVPGYLAALQVAGC